MKTVVSVVREVAGLFVDDDWLALAIVAIIALAGIFSVVLPDHPLPVGAILLFGCLGVLVANVAMAARH
jgi:hypothetical protein